MKKIAAHLSFVAFVALLLSPSSAFGQEVSGTVTDSTDAFPLPGVNVVIKGTVQGTATDLNGAYVLTVPSLSDTLVFSFVGYESKEVPISGRTQIDVALVVATFDLGGEVVVTGYGTQERRSITGAVASLDTEDFVAGNVNAASELIQGKVAGLQVSTRNGNPNDDPEVRLRGISSFGANQEPLVVVDGIIGATMDNVDPNDIESIDVLKDASAAAIYGTRGSAGVILITTKSGEAREGVSVNYNAYYTYEGIENRLDVLNGAEYRDLVQRTGFPAPDHGANTEWFKEVTQSGGNIVHNLALSGGTESTIYRVSGSFRDRQGIQRFTGFQQIGGRLNFTQWALDHDLQITVNLAATSKEQNFGFADAFKFAGLMNPTAPVLGADLSTGDPAYREDGYANTGGFFEQPLFNYFNPVAIIENGARTGESNYYNGSLRAEYNLDELIPNLSIAAQYSLQAEDIVSRNFYSRQHKVRGGATAGSLGPGRAEQSYVDRKNELFEATLHYLAGVSQDLNVEAIAGYSYNDFIDEGFSVSGGDFIADDVAFNNFTFAQDFNQGEGSVNSFRSTHRLIGFFGRANLNYDGTFFLNGSLRREGSSRFGIDNKWGTFWSAGLGVEVSNLVDISFLNSLKVRGSIGKTGQDAPESGLSLQRFAPQGNFFVNGSFIQSFGPVSNPNPDLKWEEKTEINIGVDFVSLQNRLSGRVDWYNATTSDLLFLVGVPVPPNLFPQTWSNVGELETSGLELSLDLAALRRKPGGGLGWNTGVVMSFYSETMLNKFHTEEVQLLARPGSPGLNTPRLIRVKEGEPIGQFWGPRFSGIGSNGEWLFEDAAGNEVLYGDLTLGPEGDEQVLGNGLPDFQIGWTNRLTYKDFDFNIFIEGVFGHQVANMFSLFYSVPKQISSYNVLQEAFELERLRDDPRWSSRYVENADYVRINNATLGYTFPVSGRGAIRRLRVYVSGNNLLTVTGYSGLNPQVRYVDQNLGQSEQGASGGPLAPGIERRIDYFTTRSISVGINLTL